MGQQAKAFGIKALIVSDPVMENIGVVARCAQYLQEAGLPFAKYTGVDSEPTDVHVKEALDVCRSERCDVVIAIGGGSSIDAAKAVAVMMTNEGRLAIMSAIRNGLPKSRCRSSPFRRRPERVRK
ncbi:NAD-dependent methanol dehydrogenase [Geobacillus sp. BCO2]|nr:NAD-dependent methanol dehydrogenase [Geobacillus sp. BCO2]